MARVLIRTQAWGSVTNAAGLALQNLSYALKNTDGSAATHWSAETGGSSSTANLTTDADGGAVLSGADRWIEAGEYDLTVNGKTYRVHTSGPPPPIVSVDPYVATAANVPAGIQSAIDAATNAGTTPGHIKFTPGKTYVYSAGSVPAIPTNLPGKGLVIDFTGAVLQLTTTVPRAFDWPTAVAGNTMNYEIWGGTVDANWVGGLHHTVCGTNRNGSVATGVDVHIGHIAYRRVKVINLLTDANTTVNHRRAFMHYLTSSTLSPNVDTVIFEDCDVEGGNAGFEVLGANAGTGVTIQSVHHVRCRHKMRKPLASTTNTNGSTVLSGTPQNITVSSTTGFATSGTAMAAGGGTNVPIQINYTGLTGGNTLTGCTGSGTIAANAVIAQWGQGATFGPQTLWFPASNFQVGSYATVKHVDFYSCKGYYSGDVGSEIDNKDFALFDSCHFEDAFKTNNYFTNFTTPTNPDVQTCIYRDHTSRRVLVSNAFAGGCFTCDTHSSIPLGRIRFEGECLAVNISGNITTSDILNQTGQIQSMDLDGLRCVIENFTWSAGTIGHAAIQISPSAVSGKAPNVKLGRLYVKVVGTVSAGTYTFDGLLLTPNAMALDSESPAFDLAYSGAGVTNGSIRCVELNGSGTTPTMRGRLDGLQVLNMSGDAAPRAIMVRGTSAVTINSLLITECDFSGMGAGGGEVFYVDATNEGNVRAHNNTWKTKPAPVTWSGFTTGTGFQQKFGWDAILQFAQGSGAGITAIDFSQDGGSHYTNFLTQAAGALPAGFDQCLVMPAGGWLKITFTTTQPTINVVPLNP